MPVRLSKCVEGSGEDSQRRGGQRKSVDVFEQLAGLPRQHDERLGGSHCTRVQEAPAPLELGWTSIRRALASALSEVPSRGLLSPIIASSSHHASAEAANEGADPSLRRRDPWKSVS